jgi:hypothetical protein
MGAGLLFAGMQRVMECIGGGMVSPDFGGRTFVKCDARPRGLEWILGAIAVAVGLAVVLLVESCQ